VQRDVERALDRAELVGVELAECVRWAKVVLVVAADEAACGRERDAVADAREHVLQGATRARVIEDFCRRDERNAMGSGTGAEAFFAWHVIGATMAGEDRVEPIAECVL
jgi:hypothetical protein